MAHQPDLCASVTAWRPTNAARSLYRSGWAAWPYPQIRRHINWREGVDLTRPCPSPGHSSRHLCSCDGTLFLGLPPRVCIRENVISALPQKILLNSSSSSRRGWLLPSSAQRPIVLALQSEPTTNADHEHQRRPSTTTVNHERPRSVLDFIRCQLPDSPQPSTTTCSDTEVWCEMLGCRRCKTL